MRKCFFFLLLVSQTFYAQKVYKQSAFIMGVDFEFSVVAQDSLQAKIWLQEAVVESENIEALISSWKDKSQTSQINRMAGVEAVTVSSELFDLIKRSIRISKLTHGYFDISFASIDKFWQFDGRKITLPDSLEINQSVKKINYRNILLNPRDTSVYLMEEGMKIGFGGIGKGYVAEKIKQLWKKKGVKAGLINASGDITCFGEHPQTKTWKVGITNPDKPQEFIALFDLQNSSVVTSGNYQKYVFIDGKRYTHIINPKTGWPVTGLKSVTIFCANAELADALATAVFVMGKAKGIQFINQLKEIEAILIDENNNIIQSKRLTYE